MAASAAIDPTTLAVKPVSNRQTPCEGPKAVPILCDFSKYPTYTLNGQSLVQNNRMCQIQSLYIDASGTDQQTTVTTDTGQIIRAKGRTQGWYAVTGGTPFGLTFNNTDGVTLMQFVLANVPIQSGTWATQ